MGGKVNAHGWCNQTIRQWTRRLVLSFLPTASSSFDELLALHTRLRLTVLFAVAINGVFGISAARDTLFFARPSPLKSHTVCVCAFLLLSV